MTYITRNELIDRYGQREIERLEANIKDNDATPTALSDATNLVNSYIGKQYTLPLAIVTETVKRATAVIARYYLYKDKPTETVRKDYEDILDWLKLVAKGDVVLEIDETPKDISFKSGIMVV